VICALKISDLIRAIETSTIEQGTSNKTKQNKCNAFNLDYFSLLHPFKSYKWSLNFGHVIICIPIKFFLSAARFWCFVSNIHLVPDTRIQSHSKRQIWSPISTCGERFEKSRANSNENYSLQDSYNWIYLNIVLNKSWKYYLSTYWKCLSGMNTLQSLKPHNLRQLRLSYITGTCNYCWW